MLFVVLNQGIGPHQVALADALYEILGKDFVFIEFGRKNNGQYGSYKGMIDGLNYYKDRPYILKMNESDENKQKALDLIARADVLRTGGEPIELTKERILSGKLTFRSTERLIKEPLWRNPGYLRTIYDRYYRLFTSNYRILCQSAYMANDLSYCPKSYKNKCYKFAYFTQIPSIDIDSLIKRKRKEKLQIIWCARFIDWKHPEMPVLLAKKLIESGRRDFELQMLGADTTSMWKSTKELIEEMNVQKNVLLTGGMPNTQVLERMRQSNIFIFTSDRQEGWGAVLNEAMGAGCACVASHEIGAVPFLLSNESNGLIFKSRSVDSLFNKVAYLYDNRGLCDKYGREAYRTITTDWSAQLAAKRLVELSDSILAGNEVTYEDGPCSKAYPINSNKLV